MAPILKWQRRNKRRKLFCKNRKGPFFSENVRLGVQLSVSSIGILWKRVRERKASQESFYVWSNKHSSGDRLASVEAAVASDFFPLLLPFCIQCKFHLWSYRCSGLSYPDRFLSRKKSWKVSISEEKKRSSKQRKNLHCWKMNCSMAPNCSAWEAGVKWFKYRQIPTERFFLIYCISFFALH